MSHVPATPEDSRGLFHADAPILEVFEHAVGDDKVKGAIVKRERFREGKREATSANWSIFGVYREYARKALAQKV